MLADIKTYFGITDSRYDSVITLIISKVTLLQQALKFDSTLIFQCVVEDFSRYLRSGNSSFKTSQAADIARYSPELYTLMKATMKASTF